MWGREQEFRGVPYGRAMQRITTLSPYEDANGNTINFTGSIAMGIEVNFRGANNRLVVAPNAKLGKLVVHFDCDNGAVTIGGNKGAPELSLNIRVGQDASVTVGDNVSTTTYCLISAVEGTSVEIGDDVMIASENQIRADDAHPIFDVTTGERVNPSRSIKIGAHVWLGHSAIVLGGSEIGKGSILGIGSILKGKIPNNCIAAGAPAKIVRRNVAWERPHLSKTKPYYKPDSSTVEKSRFWDLTVEEVPRKRSLRQLLKWPKRP